MLKIARSFWVRISAVAAVSALLAAGGRLLLAQSKTAAGRAAEASNQDDNSVYKDILLRIKETPTGSFMIGAGINSNAGLMGNIVLSQGVEDANVIAEVVIKGNKRVSAETITHYLLTCSGMVLDKTLVQQDVQRLLGTNLFQTVETECKPIEGGLSVAFVVAEHPVVEEILVECPGHLGGADLRELARCCGLEKNTKPNAEANRKACQAIQAELVARGYYWANVWLKRGGESDGRVVFGVNEGPLVHIRSISFNGNSAVSSEKLRARVDDKMLLLECTGVYQAHQADELARDLEHLYQGKGYCEASVRHAVKFDPTYDEAVLTFKIKEGRHYRVKNWLIDAHSGEVPAELNQVIKLRKGEFYDECLARKDADAVAECYRLLGKPVTVAVDLSSPETGFVQVSYRVHEPQTPVKNKPSVIAQYMSMRPEQFEGGAIVHVCLDKAPRQIEEVVYRNVQHVSQQTLQNLTKIQKGSQLDPVANLLACKEIQEHLKNKGRYWAKVTLEEGNRLTDQRVIFNVDEGPLVKVHSITFEGNKNLASELLSRQLDSPRTCLGCMGIFSDAAVRGDVKKLEEFCREQGYRDAKVCRELSFDNRTKVDVVFRINEGPQYYRGGFGSQGR